MNGTALPFLVTREMWVESIAGFVGRDLGRLVIVAIWLFSALAWLAVQLLRAIPAILIFVGKVYVYATATTAQRRRMNERWHARHTTRRRVNAKTYRPAAQKGARR